MPSTLKIDKIGYWSEVKLHILEEYAKPYNQIIRSNNFHPIYIDGFAGAGHHKAKGSDRLIEGSPKRALSVQPPFEIFHFVDMDSARTDALRQMSAGRPDVIVHHGDCNEILIRDVFPNVRFDQFQRALCILDPYGLNLDWQVIKAAADSRAIEIFLNFPVMDMNRNVFWHNYEQVAPASQDRMTRFWGDESWKNSAYQTVQGLFHEMEMRNSINTVVDAFRERLKKVAGFKYVPQPMPMRNSVGATVYYLFFAAQVLTAENIVKDIFRKYGQVGETPNG
ncbi:MAG: three-Cys-motif partner protein TcmP [Acidobacteriaceae bacterium]|jgi:three-Cys-motif partner protein